MSKLSGGGESAEARGGSKDSKGEPVKGKKGKKDKVQCPPLTPDQLEIPPAPTWEERIVRDWSALKYAPDEFLADKEVVLGAIRANGLAYEFASDLLKEDEDILLEAVKNSRGAAMKWAPGRLKGDREFLLQAVEYGDVVLKYIPLDCTNDDDAELTPIKGVYYCHRRNGSDGLPFPTGPCRGDNKLGGQCKSCKRYQEAGLFPLLWERGFCCQICEKNWQALKYIHPDWKDDKEVVLRAVRLNAYALAYAPKVQREDPDIVFEAIQQNAQVFRAQPKFLRSDRKIAFEAVRQDWRLFLLVGDDEENLRADLSFAAEAVRQHWQAFQHLDPQLKKDKELARMAIKQSWEALKHFPPEILRDKEIVGIALRDKSSGGEALKFAAEDLRADKDLVIEAIRNDWRSLRHASEALRGDKEVLQEALEQNAFALGMAVEDMKSDADLMNLAMDKSYGALDCAVMPCWQKPIAWTSKDKDGLDREHWKELSTKLPVKKGARLRPAVPLD